MQINLSDPNPPVKFYFDEDFPEKGHALLRRLPPAEAQKIRKTCSKKQPPEYRRGTRYEIPDKINEELLAERIWDYSICGWDGLVDQKGKPIPCDAAMKFKLMMESTEFSGFIAQKMEVLETDAKNPKDDDAVKNSSSTSQD